MAKNPCDNCETYEETDCEDCPHDLVIESSIPMDNPDWRTGRVCSCEDYPCCGCDS